MMRFYVIAAAMTLAILGSSCTDAGGACQAFYDATVAVLQGGRRPTTSSTCSTRRWQALIAL